MMDPKRLDDLEIVARQAPAADPLSLTPINQYLAVRADVLELIQAYRAARGWTNAVPQGSPLDDPPGSF